MQFGLYLVKHGLITANQFVEALEDQLASRPPLGALAIETGKLSTEQVFDLLKIQADAPQEMFGKLAVQSGFMTEGDLLELLYHQSVQVKPMSQILEEMGFVGSERLKETLAEYRVASDTVDCMEPIALS